MRLVEATSSALAAQLVASVAARRPLEMPFDEFVALRREAAAATGAAADGYRGFKETFVELLKRRGVQRGSRGEHAKLPRARGSRTWPSRAGSSRSVATRRRPNASPPHHPAIYISAR